MSTRQQYPLVLSLFPGIGMLDQAFEEEGFCVVRGPDVLWGGDIRRFHPPAGRFDGIIGGPPCQAFSRLAAMVRHNGHEPKFGNLIPEFERCVRVAEPKWFLMENVQDAPLPVVDGYGVWSTLLNNRQLGETQNRVRRWSFGMLGCRCPLMIDTVALEAFEFECAAVGGSHGRPGCVKSSLEAEHYRKSSLPFNTKSIDWFKECKRRQGLPDDFDLPPFTVASKCKAVGNGVPLAMGRAMAKAVKRATG
jgi:DNA (cytosine-5)-methyltransferase 1